jgi:hypothetical protein
MRSRDHRSAGFLAAAHLYDQSRRAHGLRHRRCLKVAGLHQQVAVGGQPARRLGGDRAEHGKAVGAAVEGGARLVVTGLGGQEGDLVARDVGRVADEDADLAAQPVRQRSEQVALVHVPAGRLDIAPGAPDGGRVDVDGVEFCLIPARPAPSQSGGRREAKRAGAAAQVGYQRVGRCQRYRGPHEELAAAAGHEHARVDEYPQAAELRPADDLLERQARGALTDHDVQLGRGARGVGEQPGLIFGEHAPGGPEPGDDVWIR